LAIKTSLAALLSLYISYEMDHFIKHPDPFVSGIWCVIASIFGLQPTLGGTYKAVWNRFLGVLLGSLIGAFFAFALGAHPFVLGCAIFTAVIVCFIFGLQDNYRMAALSVAVIMVPWGFNPVMSPWTYAFFRFLDTCVGLGVAIFVAQAVWPSQALATMRSSMVDILDRIRQYYEHALTFPENSPEKQEMHFLVLQNLIKEINQGFLQSRSVMEESKIELYLSFVSISVWTDLMSFLENLWESVREIKDVFNPSLEEVFDHELKREVKDLCEQIDFIFKDLVEKFKKEQSDYDFAQIPLMKENLSRQLVRFRETRTMKKYDLDRVENYFVFFYNIKQILNELEKINQTYTSDL
jgi:uncharacterized membrane protein YccC